MANNQQPTTNNRILIPLIGIVIGMLMLAYASVPLYKMFCRVTGYGGTTRESAQLPDTISDRMVTVRFNTDVDPKPPWRARKEHYLAHLQSAPPSPSRAVKSIGYP